ncbi:glycosyltransferase family 2 protein [Campylobacter canadensis]|uniref:Glycosyltransferase family 2 protein n=1 Tax=Campylobacter canadensis TaxID=449520 RepID=A0ABS7WT56_9BACT|nr:glycosyltransferase family 2 protein [Campylobacter canadensis]MBZ7987703.1 glycosyltransferase family 2 protein [Campylobacter canadensis]
MFSVIIPLFNKQQYIKRAILSCLNQSFSDYEIIVIDDNSCDLSLQILNEFKDKRIKIIKNKENKGTFASRNYGLLNAKNDFICFLDPDDYFLKDAFLHLKNSINEADIVCFNAFVHRVKTKEFYSYENAFFKKDEHLLFLLKQRHFCWSVWAKLFKKELLFNALKYLKINEHLCYFEDFLLCFCTFNLAKTIKISKKIIYQYEFSEDGIYESKLRLKQNYNDFLKVKEYILYLMQNDFKNQLFNEKIKLVLDKNQKDLLHRIQKEAL